ncbi:hypothetical protein J6590_044168 [Homalodisca vitripennis]|nr:hypothetical protein J6590_044168 [Homalodisca vitripennis]
MESNEIMKKRAEWNEEQMQEALNAVGNGMSVNQASRECQIPRRTLGNHLKTVVQTRKLGGNSMSSSDQESELCSRISWYCFICDEDQIRDMRMCYTCGGCVHEECVGVTKLDNNAFSAQNVRFRQDQTLQWLNLN